MKELVWSCRDFSPTVGAEVETYLGLGSEHGCTLQWQKSHSDTYLCSETNLKEKMSRRVFW